ncbi:MAG: GDP-L-fucose synthase family protein [Myxococcota bacterium]
MQASSRIFVAGHRGLVGSAVLRALEAKGHKNLLLRTRTELDLLDQAAVRAFFTTEKPEIVVLAAAKVGGIHANATAPATFIYENLTIATHVIHSAYQSGVKKLLNLGSSCIYPKLAPQPLREEHILSGPLEETNRAYAVAKIAAIEMCDHYRAQYGCDFISAMPTNLYGPHDNFDLMSSHVVPAMIRKFVEAKESGGSVTLWGSGQPRREFLYVEDMADAALHLLDHFSGPGPLNVGTGVDVTVKELAELIAKVVGYSGQVRWDASKPDGTPRKLMDVSRLTALGFRAKVGLEEGLTRTVRWYLAQRSVEQR